MAIATMPDDPDPDDPSLRERIEQFRRKKLSPHARMIFCGVVDHKKSMRQVATELELSESRVSQMFSFIYVRLQRWLSEESR